MKLINILQVVKIYSILLVSSVFCSLSSKILKAVSLPEEGEIAKDFNRILFSKNKILKDLTKKSNSKENDLSPRPFGNEDKSSKNADKTNITSPSTKLDSTKIPNQNVNIPKNIPKIPQALVGIKKINRKSTNDNVKNNQNKGSSMPKKTQKKDQEVILTQNIKKNLIFFKKSLEEFSIDDANENSDRVEQDNFFPYESMDTKEYNKFLKLSPSNSNSKLSLPFYKILLKIEKLIGDQKTKEAKSEITRLRKMDIEAVTDIIIGYSDAIKKNVDSESYWYYFYIVSNVVLKGRLIPDVKNANIFKSDFWRLKKPQSLLEKGQDKFYDYFVENDEKYDKDLAYLRNLTLIQLKKASSGGVDYLKDFDFYYPNTNRALVEMTINVLSKSKSDNPPKIREWVGTDSKRSELILADFEPNTGLNFAVERTLLYGFLKSFPKGIVHHLHWSAAFNMNDILSVISDKMRDDMKVSNTQFPNGKLLLIVKTELFLVDKTRPETRSYLDIPFPRLFIIDDFLGLMQRLKNNFPREQVEKFKDNYILGDGRCVLNPISSDASIDSDLLAFLYFRKCKNSALYSIKDLSEELSKNKYLKGVQQIEKLKDFLESQSHILEEKLGLQNKYLPSSYKDLLYNVKDQLSVAVWFKFEMIFGLYEKIFDNDSIFKLLTERLGFSMANQKVLGIEFRQGYDVEKPNSRIEFIRKQFNKSTVNNKIFVAFILPGRKVKRGHKLRQIIENLDKAKNQSDITGFDFFGYEDDPFTGARNFFPSTLQGFFEEKKSDSKTNDANNNKNNLDNDFEFLLDALRRGHKFFLHAGETLYFPNYPVTNDFLKKYYINDNLIHAALLPNMARLGHGFAANSNELIMSIYRKKGISLEICPTSNQALLYYDVKDSPIVNLLRSGVSVTVSPDDPGLFNYSGVNMDWFNLIMNTDLKLSEYYLLLRNSILKFSFKKPPRNFSHSSLLHRIQEDLKNFFLFGKFEELKKKVDLDKLKDIIKISEAERKERVERYCKLQEMLKKNFFTTKNKFLDDIDGTVNIYDIKDILKTKENKTNCK